MRIVATLILASFTASTATGGRRNPIWLAATIGAVTSANGARCPPVQIRAVPSMTSAHSSLVRTLT